MAYKTFKESLESTAVFAFSRSNPPTVEHEHMFDCVAESAIKNNAVPYIFITHTHDNRKNLLTVEQKSNIIKNAYPDIVVESTTTDMPTIIQVAKHLNEQGIQHLIMVSSSDKLEENLNKLEQYNGVSYNFKSIKVESTNQLDPDSSDLCVKINSNIIAGNKISFKEGLMLKLSEDIKDATYNLMEQSLSNKSNIQYTEADKIRELYIAGSIFKIGQVVETFDGRNGFVKYRGSNYVVVEHSDGSRSRQWLNNLSEASSNQLEFDGIITKYFDQCPYAYEQFKDIIDKALSGGYVGDENEQVPEPDESQIGASVPPTPAVKHPRSPHEDTYRTVEIGRALKPRHIRHMQFKQYLGL